MLFSLTASIVAPVLLLVHILWLGSQGRPGPELSKEEMRRHLVWKLFYLNPADPRGWVPKIYGIGWTVNFRARSHIYTFLVLLGLTLASSLGLCACALNCS